MSTLYEEKIKLGKHLKELLEERIKRLQLDINEIENSRDTNSKSSAGDKHETSRAMAQNELEKLAQQLAKAKQEYHHLDQINIKKISDRIELGSYVETTTGKYFIGVGMGIIEFKDAKVFAVSAASPVGQNLLSLKIGDSYQAGSLNGEILEIS